MSDQIRDRSISTLAELEAAVAATITEAAEAGPELQAKLSRRTVMDAREFAAAEANRIARPPYRNRAQRLDACAAVERVRALAEAWAAKAPADDWGDDMGETVFADAGREILAALEAS
jgi:hypothetical protein